MRLSFYNDINARPRRRFNASVCLGGSPHGSGFLGKSKEVRMTAVLKRDSSDRLFVAVIWSVVGVAVTTLTLWIALGGRVEQFFD